MRWNATRGKTFTENLRILLIFLHWFLGWKFDKFVADLFFTENIQAWSCYPKSNQLSLSYSIEENKGLKDSKKFRRFKIFYSLRSMMVNKTQLQFFYVWFFKQWAKEFTLIQQRIFQNKTALTYWTSEKAVFFQNWGWRILPKTFSSYIFNPVRSRELKCSGF